ncbi:anthrone oxygenase family protein [Actinomadura rudentiformis]|uniref:DUF1772 domain-containing protein n=1 Tax=Actinomadura rudentiformis TaxID=359158 RepID=A0A6H9Y8P6_9ACTN|nr:anthrone oxygenase family protein [Actinomadura rudentiformis]KAB2339621.1 DUF1772 domain-containing protein [Actinomadura rudentiformis]
MKTISLVVLVLSTFTTGLIAGFFATYTNNVMPSLGRTDDRMFVTTMQHINKVVLNPLFLLCFTGALLLTIAATILHLGGEARPALPWIIAATVLYAAMFIITMGVNVPLNDKLNAAGDPARITDLAAVRDAFEAKWNTWNNVRTLTSMGAFGCLIWALVVHIRNTV